MQNTQKRFSDAMLGLSGSLTSVECFGTTAAQKNVDHIFAASSVPSSLPELLQHREQYLEK